MIWKFTNNIGYITYCCTSYSSLNRIIRSFRDTFILQWLHYALKCYNKINLALNGTTVNYHYLFIYRILNIFTHLYSFHSKTKSFNLRVILTRNLLSLNCNEATLHAKVFKSLLSPCLPYDWITENWWIHKWKIKEAGMCRTQSNDYIDWQSCWCGQQGVLKKV